MSFTFDATGLTVQTYQEIYDELVAGYQAIYGADINLDPDSPDGQRVGIEAKARLDLQAFALSLYNQFDPDLSTGEMLNIIIKLAGITRRPGTRSQVDVTITTDRDLTLPAGYAVEDGLGQTWITLASQLLTTGANTVTLVSEDFGAIEADADTVTEPATVIIGVVSVTNPTAATVGQDEETDPELRIRRNRSLRNPATSTLGGLFSALGSVSGVTDVSTYENDTDSTDADGVPAHHVWCIVEGGTISDIIEAIAKNKTAGAGTVGTVSDIYTETLSRPDGSTYTIDHVMEFDRPTDVPIYITLTGEGIDGATVDMAAIEAALEDYTFYIAQGLDAAELYSTVYSAGDNFTATLLQISDDDTTYTAGRLTPALDEKYSIDAANITITDIT